jgi:hypothetical protein
MDGLLSVAKYPSRCYLTFFHIQFSCTSKTTGWFTKGAEIDPNLLRKVLLQGSVLIYIDGLLGRTKLCPSRLLSSFFHIPDVQLDWNDWLVHQTEIDPNLLTLVLLKVAHAFLYTWMDFSVASNCAQAVAILPSSYSQTFNWLVKRLAGSPKEWNWSQPAHANKVLLKVAFLYTLMDFFQSHKLCPPLLSYLLPQRSIALVTTGWFTKTEIDPNLLTLTKCYSTTRSYIHGWTSFSRTKLCPSRCYLTFFHIPERSIASKRLAGSPKGWNWSQPR